LSEKQAANKKCHISEKKLLRSPARIRKYRLTEADKTATADGNGGNARKSKEKMKDLQAGAPSK